MTDSDGHVMSRCSSSLYIIPALPRKYLLRRLLTFASKQTPCLNTSSLCMGILRSCASSTKLYLVTPGIALMIARPLARSALSFFLFLFFFYDSARGGYLQICASPPALLPPLVHSHRRDASLRRSSGLRRSGLVGGFN